MRTPQRPTVDGIELEKVVIKVLIEATFEMDDLDNGSDIDKAIEDALEALQGQGAAHIVERTLLGVPKK